jgi:hypothetical protein
MINWLSHILSWIYVHVIFNSYWLGFYFMVSNRAVGLTISAVGVAALVFSLILAYLEYASAERVAVGGLGEAVTGLVNVLATVMPRLVWIGVMISVGSILLSKGLQLLRVEKSD